MALTEERAACLFWSGTICAFLFTILYSSLCILKIGVVSSETCAFLEISTVASVLAFIIGMAYYCYKQKVGLSDSNDIYTHWTISRQHHITHKPRDTEVMTPIPDEDVPLDFECSICSEGKDEFLIIQLKCSHYFHKVCIQQWFKADHQMSCPLCRTSQLRRERLVVLTIIPALQPPVASQV
ncbi:uncharacterized protein LOC143062625 isoform X1 [Mytilus galloprovincialis]